MCRRGLSGAASWTVAGATAGGRPADAAGRGARRARRAPATTARGTGGRRRPRWNGVLVGAAPRRAQPHRVRAGADRPRGRRAALPGLARGPRGRRLPAGDRRAWRRSTRAVEAGVSRELTEAIIALVRGTGGRADRRWSGRPRAGVPRGLRAAARTRRVLARRPARAARGRAPAICARTSRPCRCGSPARWSGCAARGRAARATVRLRVLAGAEVPHVRVALDEEAYRIGGPRPPGRPADPGARAGWRAEAASGG